MIVRCARYLKGDTKEAVAEFAARNPSAGGGEFLAASKCFMIELTGDPLLHPMGISYCVTLDLETPR